MIFQASGPSTQPTLGPITFQVSRNAVYYLALIPNPHSQNELWLNWTVRVPGVSNGTGTVEFSQDNSTWSNLVAFSLASGQAAGRQFIDSSWAKPGQNYLRASYNQSLSPETAVVVYVNYYRTVLLILSPFFAAIILATGIYISRKRKDDS